MTGQTMVGPCVGARRRVARKSHSCQWGDCRNGGIRVGAVYLETTSYPGHDSGYADHAKRPVRMALCARCAINRFQYDPGLLEPIPYEQLCRDGLL